MAVSRPLRETLSKGCVDFSQSFALDKLRGNGSAPGQKAVVKH